MTEPNHPINFRTENVQTFSSVTILVIDIRNSSKVLGKCGEDVAVDFFEEFSISTQKALDSATPGHYEPSAFTGDGFLIFLREPNQFANTKVGPDRAIDVMLQLLPSFGTLCRQLSHHHPEAGFDTVGLAAGITFGDVCFGPLVPLVPHNCGAIDQVNLAFRLSQRALSSQILLSEEAKYKLRQQEASRTPTMLWLKGFDPRYYFQVVHPLTTLFPPPKQRGPSP